MDVSIVIPIYKPDKALLNRVVKGIKKQDYDGKIEIIKVDQGEGLANQLNWGIKKAKNEGYRYYDFRGIAQCDAPKHKWAGITRFKKGFSHNIVTYAGAYDYVFKPFIYQLYLLGKKIKMNEGKFKIQSTKHKTNSNIEIKNSKRMKF